MIVLAAASALVVFATLLLARRPLAEQWHLWRLELGAPETRVEAIRALAGMRSARGASRFAEMTFNVDDPASIVAMWSLVSYGCETWCAEVRRFVVAAGLSEADVLQRNGESFVIMLRDLTGKEEPSPATLEELCGLLVKLQGLIKMIK